jgi:hypothetical protein
MSTHGFPGHGSTLDSFTEACERHYADGRARGLVEGEAHGKARAILMVLSARGIVIDESLKARILACSDHGVLDRWITRAALVDTANELVGAHGWTY